MSNYSGQEKTTLKKWILSRDFKDGFYEAKLGYPFRDNASQRYSSGRYFYIDCKTRGLKIPHILGRKANIEAVRMLSDAIFPNDGTPSIFPIERRK